MWAFEHGCTPAELQKIRDLEQRMELLRIERNRLGAVRAKIRQRAVARLRIAELTGEPIRLIIGIEDVE